MVSSAPGARAASNEAGRAAVNASSRRASPHPLTTARTSIRIIRQLEGLDEVAQEWDSLAAHSHSPMQDLAWMRACAATFAGERELYALVVGEPGQATAIAPLVRRRGKLGRLQVLGVDELDEPTDFLFSEPSALFS